MDILDKIIRTRQEVTDKEVSQFYLEKPGVWVLLEPTHFENGRAVKLKVLKYDKDKDILRDYVMDRDDHPEHPYIFFYTGYDGTCSF